MTRTPTDCKPQSQPRQAALSVDIDGSSNNATFRAASGLTEVESFTFNQFNQTQFDSTPVNQPENEILRGSEPVLTFPVKDAASLSEKSFQLIYRLIDDGTLQSIKIAGKTRVLAASLFKKYEIAETNYSLQQALEQRARPAIPAPVASQSQSSAKRLPLAALDKYDPDAATRDDARKWHVMRFKSFFNESGLGIKKALNDYCDLVSDGSTDMPNWVSALMPRVNYVSLERWYYKYLKEGAKALESKYQGNPGTWLDEHTKEAEWLRGLFIKKPHLKAAALHEALKAHFKGRLVPSVSSVWRWLKRYNAENKQEVLLATNPDKHKNKYRASFGKQYEKVVRLNQLVEIDATPVDIIFKGEKRRQALYCLFEAYSDRRIFALAERSSGRAIGELVYRGLTEFGHIECIKTDGGMEFIGSYLTRVFSDFEIEHKISAPYSPEQKPGVERAFKTLLHDIPELLPGFIGHNVAQAQDIRARRSFAKRMQDSNNGDFIEVAITQEEFEIFLRKYEATDLHRVRKSGRLRGKCPQQIIDEYAKTHTIRRVENIERLAYLLQPAFTRVVGKDGIRYGGFEFIADELGGMVGDTVEIRPSPQTPGRVAVYADGAFVCFARECELEQVDRAEIAARARVKQNELTKEIKAEHRRLKKQINEKAIADEILAERAAGASNVRQFQRPEYITLEAATAALGTIEPEAVETGADTPPSWESGLDYADHGFTHGWDTGLSNGALMAPGGAEAPEPDNDRYIRLKRSTEPLSEDDAVFMARFETTPAGKAMNTAYTQDFIHQSRIS